MLHTHIEMLHTHIEILHTHIEKLHTHIQILHTHIEMLHTHIEMLHTHIEMLHTHIEILHTHIEILHTHIEMLHTHIEKLHTHIEILHTHIEMLHTHIQILHTHIEMLHTHIQILHTHIEISHTHIQIMEYCNVLHAIVVPRDTVYDLLKLLDPAGISIRKRKRLRRREYVSKGPNYVWHIDSYDKLKPCGIAINGRIDGFSRNVIWLEANTTNSDPRVIADYYIKAVERKSGCPQRVRCDIGTENVHVEQMQKFLRRNHNDELSGDKSFMYGKSTHNQRIEWFWGALGKNQVSSGWMYFGTWQVTQESPYFAEVSSTLSWYNSAL